MNSSRDSLASTSVLLAAVQNGDESARNMLFERYLPIMQKWAHGRLPRYARHTLDTDDLVQVCLFRALNHLEGFEQHREGAFLAYLRQILLNSIRDEIRRTVRRPDGERFETEDEIPSLVEQSVGKETVMAYEAALAELSPAQREAVVLRIEFGFSFPEIATAMNKPSANAARMMVSRALVELAQGMGGRP